MGQPFRGRADFRLAAGPRQKWQQLLFARAHQRVFQAAQQIPQPLVDQLESFQPKRLVLDYRDRLPHLSIRAARESSGHVCKPGLS